MARNEGTLYTDTKMKISFDSFTAASNGDLSYFIKYRAGNGENFTAANKAGWTPIMYACARGHALLVSYMMMCGVKTNCKTKSQVTLLMLAITSGDLPTVEYVFKASDLEARDYRMWTPLFYAVFFLQEKCVKFLISKGAKVNVVDYQNETPLILAIKSGSETIVDILLTTANNLDIVSYKNESAIMLAKESKNKKIRESVLRRNEDILNAARERNPPITPKNKFLALNKENMSDLTPSPSKKNYKNRSFLGLKINKSLSYSPNDNKSSSIPSSPNENESDMVKHSFWKMCITTTPAPSTSHYEVENLLKSLELEKYWPIFRDEEVDFDTLLTFTEENLKELGITHFGPRKKILFAINQLRLIAKE